MTWTLATAAIMAVAIACVLTLMPPRARAQTPTVRAPSGIYLGAYSRNANDPNSVANEFGRYGSPFDPDSINNLNGRFGSPFSPDGVNNEFAISPEPFNANDPN